MGLKLYAISTMVKRSTASGVKFNHATAYVYAPSKREAKQEACDDVADIFPRYEIVSQIVARVKRYRDIPD